MKLLLVAACLALSLAEDYDMRIVERGLLLDEHVTLVTSDLVLLQVPRHHDLQHVSVALDFRSNQSLTLFHTQGYCQLSALPSSVPRPQQQKQGLDKSNAYVYYAGLAQNLFFVQVQSRSALTDLTELRTELRDMCKGKLVYQSRSLQTTQDLKEGEEVLLPDPTGHSGLRVRRQNEFFCPIEKFYQKCLTKQQGKSCYYTIMCQDIEVGTPNPQCIQHLRNINVECVPCCKDDRTPDDGFIRACSRTDVRNPNQCQRLTESKCFKQGDACARTFTQDCMGTQSGSVEACGKWECD